MLKRRDVFAVGASALLAASFFACGKRRAEMFGARLGMTMSDARSRFQPGSEGTFTQTNSPDLVGLEWQPAGTVSEVRKGLLEFHNGMLVAVHAEVKEGHALASGLKIEVSGETVTVREPIETGWVKVSMIAQDCPAHAKEVKRLLDRQAR